MDEQFTVAMKANRQRLERLLGQILSSRNYPDPVLAEAMRYAVLGGGKRLRAMLAWASAEALGAGAESAVIPACALELIHAYSLVHDDLPAMDDDRLRRGKPTCHIRYGEATAILAGDALQTLAFELLAESRLMAVSDKARLVMIRTLAQAAGSKGMVAGQSLDIQAEGKVMTVESLQTMHSLKTGELIRASVLLGALCNARLTSDQMALLRKFAANIGLAFQIRDDILDVISDTATLGKQQGRDMYLQKPTYVSELGLEGAETRCRNLIDEALELLQTLNPVTDSLQHLARYVGQRSH